jgi:tetratricopeptide (TPR) repeat protein
MMQTLLLKYLTLFFLSIIITTSFAQNKEDDKAKQAMNNFLDAEKNKMLENYPEAIKLYVKTIEIDSTYDPAMYEMSRLLAMQQKYAEALFWVEKAYQLDPTNKWYGLMLIDLYRSNYQINEAAEVYENLLIQEPNNTDYILGLSSLYTLLEEYEKALNLVNNIERINGISEKTRFQMRNLYLQKQDFDKAVESMVELSKAFPEEEKYCSMIAEMFMQNKQPEKALEWYQKVLEINPNNPYIQITLADYYGKTGDQLKAYEYLKQGYSNPNLDIDTKIQVLVNYFETKDQKTIIKERAYELADILVKTHSEEPKAHAIYGDLLYSDSLYLEASQQFLRVIELDSTRYAVWEQLLYSLSMLNNNEEMAEYSSRAINLFPQMQFPYYVNAIANFQLGNVNQVIESLEQGLYFVNNVGLEEQFYMFLGDAYHEIGEAEKAYENYEKCLKLNPKNSFVLNNYAYYLSLENKDLEKAAKMAQTAVETDPNENNLDTYGWVLYQLGKYEEAAEYIGKSIELTENPSSVVLEHMGDVYWKLGDLKKAEKFWKKAIKAGGDETKLNEKLNRK